MPNDFMTIADCVADALDVSQAEISDLLNAAPFFTALPFTPSSNGTVHKYARQSGAPVVGFRAENAGRFYDHSEDTVVTVNLKILDFSSKTDKAVADAWRRGGAAAYVARESFRHLQAAMFKAEQQFLNGVNSDAAGFVGFADATSLNQLSDTMVINGGSEGTEGSLSSVYLVRMHQDSCSGVMVDGNPLEIGDAVIVDAQDGDGKSYPAYYVPACTWLGIQIGSTHDVARICNLTVDSPLTDDLISDAISCFKAGFGPTHIVMNRRSLKQLQQSRTATNATGAPAPFPQESFGVPIIVTDALSNAETEVT